MRKGLLTAGIIAVTTSMNVHAENDFVIDIGGISFDDLINTTITSVSKQEEKIQTAAAAVFVLNSEDIRRARVTNIPDALRLVPGVHVVQEEASTWGVSIRGFNTSVFNNKLLILIDGRSVYDPLYAGTFWQVQDTLLQDIERIEVIRGPGGALWGSNAVNGVINIITKSATDTQGGLLELGAGDEERAFGSVRYGWKTAGGHSARAFAKFNERDQSWNEAGAKDDWRIARGGFRLDGESASGDSHTLQGDVYNGRVGPQTAEINPLTGVPDSDGEYEGANLLYRWSTEATDGSGFQVQAYWDYTDLDLPTLGVSRNTFDIEFQKNFASGKSHRVIFGGGARQNADRVTADILGGVSPEESEDRIFNLFLQDTIRIPERNATFTVGAKLSDNDFTGVEFQPSARVSWTGLEKQTLWGAISRAVRTPSRLETDFPGFSAKSRDHINSEELVAFELGHRIFSERDFSIETTAFLNDYDQLIIFEQNLSKGFFVEAKNALKGRVHGLEINSTWQVASNWRLDGSLTYLEMDLRKRGDNTALDATGTVDQSSSIEDGDPHLRGVIRSSYDLAPNLEIDTIIRHAGKIKGPTGLGRVLPVTALDLGVTWRPRTDLTLGLTGRNLLDSHHPERAGATATSSPERNEVQRGVFGTATWRF